MKTITTVFFIIVFSVMARSQDTRWILIGSTDNDNCFVYYDSETLKVNPNNTYAVWIKYVYLKPKTDGYRKIEKRLDRYIVDCPEHTIGTLDWITYFTDGTSDSDMRDAAFDVRAVIPDSIGEIIYNQFCK
jgi:hypothetical protein